MIFRLQVVALVSFSTHMESFSICSHHGRVNAVVCACRPRTPCFAWPSLPDGTDQKMFAVAERTSNSRLNAWSLMFFFARQARKPGENK